MVIAMGHKSYNPLEQEVQKYGCGVHVIGDARKAGLAMEAIQEAVECAVRIKKNNLKHKTHNLLNYIHILLSEFCESGFWEYFFP